MSDEFLIQTESEELAIRNRQTIKETVEDTITNIENNNIDNNIINNKLDILLDVVTDDSQLISDVTPSTSNSLSIDELIDQNNNLLYKIKKQDEKITNLENKIDLILQKLDT